MSRILHNDGVSFLNGQTSIKTASDFYYLLKLSLVWLIPRCNARNNQLRNTRLENFCSRLKIQLCCIKPPGTKKTGAYLLISSFFSFLT